MPCEAGAQRWDSNPVHRLACQRLCALAEAVDAGVQMSAGTARRGAPRLRLSSGGAPPARGTNGELIAGAAPAAGAAGAARRRPRSVSPAAAAAAALPPPSPPPPPPSLLAAPSAGSAEQDSSRAARAADAASAAAAALAAACAGRPPRCQAGARHTKQAPQHLPSQTNPPPSALCDRGAGCRFPLPRSWTQGAPGWRVRAAPGRWAKPPAGACGMLHALPSAPCGSRSSAEGRRQRILTPLLEVPHAGNAAAPGQPAWAGLG